MNSIDFHQANELLNFDLVDLELCFDPLFYPPEDFKKTSDNQRRESNPFTCMEEHRIGNTFYLVETEFGGTEPLPYKIRRLFFPTGIYTPDKVSLSKGFPDKEAD